MKVLIVSETPAQRHWVAQALGSAWDVAQASNGREALRMVEDDGVDLVVADETTEPFGAFGLARELKVMIDPPKMIVLLERAQDAWLARWSGADRWLVRPVDSFALSDAAKELTAPQPVARRKT